MQTENKHFASVIDQIRVDVESGSSLSGALRKHPKQFNHLYVSMVRAGETGGSLDSPCKLAAIIEKQVELRGKIKSAMTYPIAVLPWCVILSAMLLFIVPIFKKMYASWGASCPRHPALISISSYA